MVDKLKSRLQSVAIALGILGTLAGSWATVVVRGKEIQDAKDTNEKQSAAIEATQKDVIDINGRVSIHAVETAVMQKNIETLQKQHTEAVKTGNERYIEMIRLLKD